MNDPSWAEYLPVEGIIILKRQLRSNWAPQLVVPLTKGPFQDSVSKLYNELPKQIRSRTDSCSFNRMVKDTFCGTKPINSAANTQQY